MTSFVVNDGAEAIVYGHVYVLTYFETVLIKLAWLNAVQFIACRTDTKVL